MATHSSILAWTEEYSCLDRGVFWTPVFLPGIPMDRGAWWLQSMRWHRVERDCESQSLYSPWNSPGQNTAVGSLSLLQGIFPIQGSNPGFPHCRWILYHLSHQGSPRILEWVAYPFSSGSSQPGNQTRVSCIAGGFFTN